MKSHIYFPNLNGLRFIAAFLVIISHLEWMKFTEKMDNYAAAPFIKDLGSLGVSLFFVLSGFLITYLLLQEKKETGDISIKKFYIRRMLRIWPVYYVTVILSFFVLPNFISISGYGLEMYNGSYYSKLFFFSFLMANVSYSLYSIVPFASQLWSVGVEEQFYLFWPLINKKFKKNLHKILIYIIVLIVTLRIIFQMLYESHPDNGKLYILHHFIEHFRIQDMAIGGLGAIILFYKKELLLKFIHSRDIEIINLTAAVVSVFSGMNYGIFNEEVYAMFFVIIILNAASNPNTILNLEGKLFKFLGKISYGLYVYQILAIKIAMLIVFTYCSFKNDIQGNVFYYLLSTVLTIAISSASYYLMERKLLSLKEKFTLVPNN